MDRRLKTPKQGSPFAAIEKLPGVEGFTKKGNAATFFVGKVAFILMLEEKVVTLLTACPNPKMKEWEAFRRVEDALRES